MEKAIKAFSPSVNSLNGLWLASTAAFAGLYLSEIGVIKAAGLSPLLLAMLVGIFYGNTLRPSMPAEWVTGFHFATKKLLRLAIVLFGFKVTIHDITDLGFGSIAVDSIIVVSTLLIGYFAGTKILQLDRETSLLCAAGSAICGAAAVLATEGIVRSNHAKTAVAVATVVVFGTIAMFTYPVIYHYVEIGLTAKQFGVFVGATVHEVAQVAAVGNVISLEVAQYSIISKMTRVLMLVPALIIVGYFWQHSKKLDDTSVSHSAPFPWFAIGFVAVTILNSLNILPTSVVQFFINADTVLLAIAMAALGMETTWERIKHVGAKPFWLGLIMFSWLIISGYVFVKIFV